jgi:hypothetical protein
MKAEQQRQSCHFCGAWYMPVKWRVPSSACFRCWIHINSAVSNHTSLIVVCEACERTEPELLCENCGGRFHRECWEGHECQKL